MSHNSSEVMCASSSPNAHVIFSLMYGIVLFKFIVENAGAIYFLAFSLSLSALRALQ